MPYIKFNDVNDAQAYENACAYADEIGLLPVVVMTDTGKVFSTMAQLSQDGLYFESDSFNNSFNNCKWGKVVAWALEDNPIKVAEPADPIQQIIDWFKAAKPEPTEKDKATQLGAHFEEVAEMMMALDANYEAVQRVSQDCYKSEDVFHNSYGGELTFPADWKEQLLDACGDQIVTAVGFCYMMGWDIRGALAEIIRSNNSKFVDGKPIKNKHGKIMKGENYTTPNLKAFLNDGA